MRFSVLVAALAAAALGAAAVRLAVRPATAQEEGPPAGTVHVSGLRIDGTRARAVVRLTNTSTHLSDVYGVHYTVQALDGSFLSLPAAGPAGAALQKGRTLELDLGKIVTQYRASFGLRPYVGEVRFVAYGDRGAYTNFGPATVHVTAVQKQGAARFEPLVDWR